MLRIFLLLSFAGSLLHFTPDQDPAFLPAPDQTASPDTLPIKVDEALIQELLGDLNEKTWRDSGYYFQLEPVFWQAVRLGTTQNGDVIVQASFSSADPSSLMFNGRAIFRFDPKTWPENITPSQGMQGEAVIAFPQDVLFCPSPAQEVGLGQNDPFFPLYLSGKITGVNASPDQSFLNFETAMSVQLRDFEVRL